MKKSILITISLITGLLANAQQFINKAVIEYEVKANVQKTMGNNVWEEMLKENLPTFKTGYYTYTFANNKSIYKFDHWTAGAKVPEFLRRSDEENIWYVDHNSRKVDMQKNIWGSNIYVEDSLPELQWKLISNESRVIAGFNCRKAVAKMFDSVYVFAFYTDEITISGGPCSITGLPGAILGLTIPRLYTSWIATKVMVNSVNESVIKPIVAKKPLSFKALKETLDERTKDWYGSDDNKEETKQQIGRFFWNTML
jgi:GLPGLI family protein